MEKLITAAIDAKITRDMVEEYVSSNSISLSHFYNEISLEIAKRYDSGNISYTDADCAMNCIYPFWIDDAAKFGNGFELPEPADSIYLAFDAGEYDHGDGDDPEQKYTKPLIKEILNNAP